MHFKAGVVVWRLHDRIVAALPDIDRVTRRLFGRDACITSAREGEHSPGSLHYEGAAIDLRTRDLNIAQKVDYAAALREVLGDDFDIVIEPSHIHIEYDPDEA